jgi:hypothetical protein
MGNNFCVFRDDKIPYNPADKSKTINNWDELKAIDSAATDTLAITLELLNPKKKDETEVKKVETKEKKEETQEEKEKRVKKEENEKKDTLSKLRSIEIRFSQDFTDYASIESHLLVVEQCKKLTQFKVDFQNASEVTEETIVHITKALETLTKLESIILNFNGCTKVSDEGLTKLVAGLSHLKVLYILEISLSKISSKPKISNEASLPPRSLTNIKNFSFFKNLNRLSALTHLTLDLFTGTHLTNLKELNESLKEMTKLTYLNLTFSSNSLETQLIEMAETFLKKTSLTVVKLNIHESKLIEAAGMMLDVHESLKALKHIQAFELNFAKSSIVDVDWSKVKYDNITINAQTETNDFANLDTQHIEIELRKRKSEIEKSAAIGEPFMVPVAEDFKFPETKVDAKGEKKKKTYDNYVDAFAPKTTS